MDRGVGELVKSATERTGTLSPAVGTTSTHPVRGHPLADVAAPRFVTLCENWSRTADFVPKNGVLPPDSLRFSHLRIQVTRSIFHT
jgi:hypothetical protein